MLSANTFILLPCIFTTALIASLIMVPFLCSWGVKHKVLDLPNERKVHIHGVPRLGGVAICLVFIFTLLLFVDMQQEIRAILAGVLIIFVTGLMDDLCTITPMSKLFGELCAALTTMVVGNLYIRTLGDLFGSGEIVLPFWLSVPFTLVAIVGVVNAFNLIDGLDGLSGGVTVITLVAFGLLAFLTANREVLMLCVVLLGAVLGFLRYNFFPARIFMGDAGSLMIGFVISFLALRLTQGDASQVQPVVPLLVIGLPVADTVWVLTSRLCARQSPFVADRTHVHHKFLDLGFEHRSTVILLYAISMFWAATAVLFRDKPAVLLLGGYLALILISYGAINLLLTRQQLIHLLARDSAAWLRESATYRLLVERVAATVPLVHFFFFACLALANVTVAGHAEDDFLFKALLVSIVACIALPFYSRDSHNQFRLPMYYGAVIAFGVLRFTGMEFTSLLLLRQWGDLLLVCSGLLTAFWLIYQKLRGFHRTNLDYFLLGLCLFLTVVGLSERDLSPNQGAAARNHTLHQQRGNDKQANQPV